MPENLKNLIRLLGYLPGIGDKSATKLAFFLLNSNQSYLENISNQLTNLHDNIGRCENCGSLVDKNTSLCSICSSSKRDHQMICIVEEYMDMITLENAGTYEGVYHILGGAISPINGVFVGDLNFEKLFERIANEKSTLELIFATNPNIEGEATLQYIMQEIEKRGLKPFVKTTRLSRGLSSGYLEYADNITLINSLKERKEV